MANHVTHRRPAKFCEHGIGLDFLCADCGSSKRKGVHTVPWNKEQQAYVAILLDKPHTYERTGEG